MQEELAQKNLEESKLRRERGQKMRTEDRERELEELRPKARSALAARWEETVKTRSGNTKGQNRVIHKATVLSGDMGDRKVGVVRRRCGYMW